MADKRMFSKQIIDSDAFLDMSLSTQALYFHLNMRADDDGFINNPKKIQRMIGCGDDELKLLIAKKFVIPFESGVCVIKHWLIHNYIRKDTYKATVYTEEKSLLATKENRSYTLELPSSTSSSLECNVPVPQYRLDKNSIDKNSIDNISKDISSSTKVQPIVDKWNSLGLQRVVAINPGTNRHKLLNARIKDYGIDEVIKAIENINSSSFLKGQNNKSWTITFDWFIKPNNFIKVLEGNYSDKGGNSNYGSTRQDYEPSSANEIDFSKYTG